MAEVGVLNLTIHDNSEESAKGLDRLDDALVRIKHAVSGGLKLSTVATSLKKLTDVINNDLSGSTLVKLGQLADELSKLKGMGDLNIRIGGGTSIESIRSAVRETMQNMSGINTGFEDIKGSAYDAKSGIDGINASMRQTQELMQNKAWSGGIDQFREMFEAYSRIISSMSLPAGDQTGISTDVEKGWTEGFTTLKDEAIEVEGTVSDAVDTMNARLGEPIQYLTGMSSEVGNLNDYLGQTNQLMVDMAQNTSAMSSGKNAIIPYTGEESGLEETVRNIRQETEQTTDSLEHMHDAAESAVDRYDEAIEFARRWNASNTGPDFSAEKEAADYVDRLISSATQIELVEMRIDALRDKLINGVNTGKMTADEIAKTVNKIRELNDELRNLKTESGGLGKVFSGLREGISNLGITKLIGQFARLARTRMLRAVIKQIAAGFKEGVQNVYEYSKAIKSDFAPNMDSAASSLLTMKNSIGAAVAPLLQSLIPVMQTLVNWFITGINYLNQFIALLRGQSTWTRALPATTSAFSKQEKAAKKAGAAIKDLLADWDELNIIQSNTSGAGGITGSSSAEDYLKMFEEVKTFDNKIKDIVKFIKDNLKDILTTVGLIGGSILAWRISGAFAEALPILGKIAGAAATLGTIAITLALTDLTGKAFVNNGGAGWFIADALTGAIGSTIAWSMAKKIAGGAVANEVAGFTLVLAGAVNIENALGAAAQQQTAKWGMLTVLGSVETGVGAALIAKGIGLTTAFSFGLGAMAAVGAVAISVGALIQISKDNIDWGNVTLTDDDVTHFVEQKMFNGLDVRATVDLIEVTVQKVSASKEDIRNRVASMLGEINSIKLGVDKESSYENLKKQIFGDEKSGTEGLISKIQTYATNNVQELKTTFALIPLIDHSGKDVSKEFLDAGISGWAQVDAYVNKLGQDLGTELSKGFTEDGLANFDEDAVKAIMDKMVKISQIITGSQIEASAQADLSLGLADLALGDLDKASVDKIVSLFSAYKSQLEEEYTKIYKDAANQYLVLSRYYAEVGDTAMSDFYKAQYDELIANMSFSVNSAVERAAGPGIDMIYDFLHEKFGDVFYKLGLNLEDGGTGAFHQWLISNFSPTKDDIEKSASDFNAAMAKWLGGENMFLNGLLAKMPNLNIWGMLSEEMQNDLYGILREKYGDDFADALIRTYVPAVQEAEEGIKENLPDIGADNTEPLTAPIDAEVKFQIDESQVRQDLIDKVHSALEDGTMSYAERTALDFTFGEDLVNEVLKELQYNLDENGNITGGIKPRGLIASTGVSDTGWMPYTPQAQQENADISGDVAKGTAQGNAEQNDLIQQLINIATRISNKEFKVNVIPSATWGGFNSRSNSEFNKVTG